MAAKYQVHEYTQEPSLMTSDVNMIYLVQSGYVQTEWMQDAILDLRVGDEQLSDKDNYFIRRVA